MSISEDDSPRTPLKTGNDLSIIIQNLNANIRDQTPEEIEREQQAILDSIQSNKQMIQLRQRKQQFLLQLDCRLKQEKESMMMMMKKI